MALTPHPPEEPGLSCMQFFVGDSQKSINEFNVKLAEFKRKEERFTKSLFIVGVLFLACVISLLFLLLHTCLIGM